MSMSARRVVALVALLAVSSVANGEGAQVGVVDPLACVGAGACGDEGCGAVGGEGRPVRGQRPAHRA